MNDRAFPAKPFLTCQEQVALLKERGLAIDNPSSAADYLGYVNYYRLAGYLHLMEDAPNHFRPGASFADAVALCAMDRALRHLLNALLDEIEIAFRTRVAYALGGKTGPLGYLDPKWFIQEGYHRAFVDTLQSDTRSSREPFVRHHNAHYGGNLPIWVAVEVMSFGTVSRLYANLQPDLQEEVARLYAGISRYLLGSWVWSAVVTRNICAHRGRLYGRHFDATPKLPRRHTGHMRPASLFAAIWVLRDLCPDAQEWQNFTTNLEAVVERYAEVADADRMGLPTRWAAYLRTGTPPVA